ncbi:putative histidine kinase group protein [Apodospora peruviana]|uniref:Histidine kinase group protein n=1 Tax=Apodospora peruviana TaxID=516989 RepID=A0AAE0IT29_9PEZI|nr:putative histidine kinase group protein [Apodospora peruviana]
MQPELLNSGIIDLLEADPRPSFIVATTPLPATIVYTNPALGTHPVLFDVITAPRERNRDLWEWITSSPPAAPDNGVGNANTTSLSFLYLDTVWTRSVIQQQMVVVGANAQAPSSEPPRKVRLNEVSRNTTTASACPPPRIIPIPETVGVVTTALPRLSSQTNLAGLAPDYLASDSRSKSTSAVPVVKDKEETSGPVPGPDVAVLKRSITDPGWILPDIMPEQRPFLEVIHSVDWAATPLGPMKEWPARLEQTFNQILADSRPIVIYWGSSYSTIYNEAFSKLCGSKHPALLGMPVEDAWRDAGEQLKEAMGSIARKQRGLVEDEWRFFVERESDVEGGPNWLEETYLKWSIVPIVEDNQCLGFMHPVLETTSMRLWERRMKMLIELGEALVTARDVKSYWEKTLQQLAAVDPCYDVPMVILYSVEDDPDVMSTNPPLSGPNKRCRLEGALGVPEGHPIAPELFSLQTDDEALSPLFKEALTAPHPLLLQTKDGSLPETLLHGFQCRGFEEDPCRAAVICPIRPTKAENAMGLLLLGLNPRRPYDNDYRQYISLLSQKLTTSLASIVLLEEEARRGRNAAEQAAYDQAMLKEKLAVQTKEANESIQMFEAVAEFVPVGMCFGELNGGITFANDAWYKITGYPGTGPIKNEVFLSCVKEEDRQTIATEYEKLKTAGNVEFEFRVKPQSDTNVPPLTRNSPSFEKAGLDFGPKDEMKERHVLATAKAERAADGSILRILTCLTDVTAHKQAAEEAVRRAQQAENLKRMAEFATVGMYDMDLEGRLLGANNVFFEMCGLEKVDPTDVVTKPWETCVYPEDYTIIQQKLQKMVLEDKVQNVEIRLKTTWTAEDGAGHKVAAARWVQATLMPVRTTEGVIQSFTGCLSDVSLQKWQLEREKLRKEEAIESKRQQENFIDMTSHEMRNPLSAIVHCADAITATLTRVQELVDDVEALRANEAQKNAGAESAVAVNGKHADLPVDEVRSLLESSIDSAETIVGCAQHQKRIVDDILTMSKLDSKLLAITPITVNPVHMVKEALKMFEVEARRVDINLSMIVDSSYRDLGITYLDFDPSRLKQVLINLLTNALKFTKTGPTRNVSVAIRASLAPPTEATSSVQFIPRSQESYDEDYDQPALRGRGDPVFLMFEVKDTGQGLSEEEKKSLFQRFVQASSRTHVKYGGSGLGLFISRRLTELQNGAIGVASQPGVGSTFAFYIEAYVPSAAAIREAEANAESMKTSAPGLAKLAGTAERDAGAGGAVQLANIKSGSTSSSRPSPAAVSPISDSSSSFSSAPQPQISGIMVVEDNLINQQITRRGLVNMGFTVDVANHGIECLDKLRRTDRFVEPSGAAAAEAATDCNGNSNSTSTSTGTNQQTKFPLSVILMDIEMPIQDGLTCTRNIRELERKGYITGGRLPIIAVSANARLEQIMEAKEAGCDDVLVKPYRMPELLEKMRVVMATIAAHETPT